MTGRLRTLCLALNFLTLCGCDGNSPPASKLPTAQMTVGSKTYTLEIAAREFDRAHGLMQRDSMPSDHGMVFVFKDEREQNFYMRNTRIPLDIVYVSSGGKVVSVKHMEPYKEDLVPSDGPVRFAIELNAGEAQADGIKQGDTVTLPPSITEAEADP